MKNGEKYFILSNDLIHTVAFLPKEKAGELFMHILEFVNERSPVSEDPIINISFEPIKKALIADFERRSKRSIAGKKSADTKQSSTKFNKVQQSSTQSNKTEKIDYQEIMDIFNLVCDELPKARLTPERQKLIDRILKTYSLQEIGTVFKNTKNSDYLNGKVNKWKADFNWLLNPTNFIKVLEGNYANVSEPKPESVQEQWKKADDAVNNYFR